MKPPKDYDENPEELFTEHRCSVGCKLVLFILLGWAISLIAMLVFWR